jgi:hypothetical protein
VPEGWKTETIPFPLQFAPDLPYRGVEEIRFGPSFFEPDAPFYFSYAFVWWLDGAPELSKEALERDLGRYFAGLCNAVGGKTYSFDPARFKATLAPMGGAPRLAAFGVKAFGGTLDTYDPFEKGKGRAITLHVEIAVGDCSEAGRRVVLVAASPKPRPDAVWQALDERVTSFSCPGGSRAGEAAR